MEFIVFAVDAADRISLLRLSPDGTPTLRTVALSYIQCPRISRRSPNGEFSEEDPFAFECVELLRQRFIGKAVRFKEDYIMEGLQREAGRMTLVDGGADATQLVLVEGYGATTKEIPTGMEPSLHKKYYSYMRTAFAARKGIFASEEAQLKHVRTLVQLSPEEVRQLGEKLMGRELMLVVERAISPTCLVVVGEPFAHTQIPLSLTGICTTGSNEVMMSTAKFFTEKHLLHRRVNVRMEGVDAMGNMIGAVVSSAGSFQEQLLREGLAKIFTPTVTLSGDVQQLLQAEDAAKAERRGIWKNYTPPQHAVTQVVAGGAAAPSSAAAEDVPAAIPTWKADGERGPDYTGERSFQGKLVQVIHGDTLVIRPDGSQEGVRVSLSGVRCNKSVARERDGGAAECRVTYKEYALEAREFVRSRYIGWRVTVRVDFVREIPETNEMRLTGIVMSEDLGVNVGAALLQEGLATFFIGRNGSCSSANQYRIAETLAKAEGKGIHGGPSPITTIVELSHLGEARSRYYLSFLQRGMQGNRPPVLKGIVDAVASGNSLRVYVPKENFQIPVRLAGVVAPTSLNKSGDAYADESRNYVVDRVLQREVSIQVYTSDRSGTFIGAVLLADGTNLSVAIVQAGLAAVGNADRLPFYAVLQEAEAAAKAQKRYIWDSNESLPQRVSQMQAKKAAQGGAFTPFENPQWSSYVCTDVAEDGLSFFLQPNTETVEESKAEISDALELLVECSKQPYKPSVGQLVGVRYTADENWYRGKVLRLTHLNGEGAAVVQFADFGNIQTTKFADIRSIPRMAEYTVLLNTAPLAIQAKLAFVKPQLPAEAQELSYAICSEYLECELQVRSEYRDAAGTVFYTISKDGKQPFISEELLSQGGAFLEKRAAALKGSYDLHAAACLTARQSHVGVWQFGDADEDDE